MTRRAAVVKVQIAKRDLGLDDPTYRAMLERLTGQSSSTACTDDQLGVVLGEMKAKGWTPKVVSGGRPYGGRSAAIIIDDHMAPHRRRPASSPMAKKARAMWISLHQLGVVRDPSEKSLESFGRRQLGVDKLQWADESQAYRLIEALKAMADRAGWHTDTSNVRLLKERLWLAQTRRLHPEDAALAAVEASMAERLTDDELDAAIKRDADVIWGRG